MKDSFSRAACNYVEKNCNLRRYNELLSKSMLVALCENKGEKTIETSVSIWRGFSLLFNRGFSRLLVLFEKFRCFWRGRHCKEGMQMTRQFYFEVTFKHDMATADWKKSEYKTILGRRNSWRKKLIRERKELLLEKCKKDFICFGVETKLGNAWNTTGSEINTKKRWADIGGKGCANNVTIFFIIFVTAVKL